MLLVKVQEFMPLEWVPVASKFLAKRGAFFRYTSPSPNPLWPHPTDKWLNCSLSELHLYPHQWESRSRTWMGGTSTHTTGHPHSLPRPVAECPPLGPAQKQPQFYLTDDLGNAPSQPTELVSFLGEDITNEWINNPSPLLPQPWILHSYHTMIAPSIVQPLWEEPNQKPALPSLQLPFKLSSGIEEHPIQ